MLIAIPIKRAKATKDVPAGAQRRVKQERQCCPKRKGTTILAMTDHDSGGGFLAQMLDVHFHAYHKHEIVRRLFGSKHQVWAAKQRETERPSLPGESKPSTDGPRAMPCSHFSQHGWLSDSAKHGPERARDNDDYDYLEKQNAKRASDVSLAGSYRINVSAG